MLCFKESTLQTNCRRVFCHTQPCLLPIWIPVTSPDLIGLHSTSRKNERENVLDSYGLPPSSYSRKFTNFLNNNSNSLIFNTVTLQSINSKVCGHYCIYYALFRCRDINMSTIVHRFSNNKRRNDFLVKRFVEKYFPLSLKKYTHVNAQGVRAQHQVH